MVKESEVMVDVNDLCPNINERNTLGTLWLKDFDKNPGGDILDKTLKFGGRGAFLGLYCGALHAAIVRPPPEVNGFIYSLRHAFRGAFFTGGAGLALGATIPIVQAFRKKDDYVAFSLAGFNSVATFLLLRTGSFGTAGWYGFFGGVMLGLVKYHESYKEPFVDPYKYIRTGKPKPDLLPLFDENNDIIVGNRY